METYTYNPLKDACSVRFVRLLPAAGGGIHCEIFRASLTSKVNYIALSYAWGCVEKTRSITCNGRRLWVTESLLSALQRLRLPTESRVFWIDAICINQENVPERNHQVSLVRDIYKKAQQLYVWLGPGEKYSNHKCALDLMRTFSAAQFQAQEDAAYLVRQPTSEQWLALAKLLQRSWFERMWVIQELAMGLKLTGENATVFLCGSLRFGLGLLKDACAWCVQVVPTLRLDDQDSTVIANVLDGAKRVLVLCNLTNTRTPAEIKHQPWRQWLLAKVAATRDKKATDPKDKLFALYGFLYDSGVENVPIADYSMTVNEIFHRFAHEFVIECQSTDVFSEVEEPGLRRLHGVPSWVPDWTALPERIPLLHITEGAESLKATGLNSRPSYRAGGNAESTIHSLYEESGGLVIDGIIVDEIAYVSEPLTADHLTEKQEEENGPCFLVDLFQTKVSAFDPRSTGTPSIEAFYQTLIAGREDNDQYLNSFIAFWESLHHAGSSGPHDFHQLRPETLQILGRRSMSSDLVLPSSAGRPFHPSFSPHTYTDLLLHISTSRTFFTTLNHPLMGLGVRGVQPGDLIVVFSGAKVPFVIRRLDDEVLPPRHQTADNNTPGSPPASVADLKHHKAPRSPLTPLQRVSLVGGLIGEAYVHGIMSGEAVRWKGKRWERVALV